MSSPLRPLYNWILRQAEKPYVAWLLLLFAVIEPCIFPTPPDILLVPAVLARRSRAYHYATICTLGSLMGAFIGYSIGAMAMASVGDWIIQQYHLQDALESFRASFYKWGTLVIIAKASVPFIPVPFFLVAILSGAIKFSLAKFMFAVAGVRITRFFMEAYLLRRFGEPIRVFIERHLNWIVLGGIGAVVLWLLLAHQTM